MGLGKGGSLENALVVKNNSLLNKEGFYINNIYKDLANNDRCIVCTKI